MTMQMSAGKYLFDPKLRQKILDLNKHREPGYPIFITLRLHPVNQKNKTVKSTMWYADKKPVKDGRIVNRYHVQPDGGSKVMPAFLDKKEPVLKVVIDSEKIDKA